MARLYDPACYDLAVHFLCDDHAEESDRACLDELSQLIQNTIEGFLSTHECRQAVPLFCQDCGGACSAAPECKCCGVCLLRQEKGRD